MSVCLSVCLSACLYSSTLLAVVHYYVVFIFCSCCFFLHDKYVYLEKVEGSEAIEQASSFWEYFRKSCLNVVYYSFWGVYIVTSDNCDILRK